MSVTAELLLPNWSFRGHATKCSSTFLQMTLGLGVNTDEAAVLK
jgi:hypothetical protein